MKLFHSYIASDDICEILLVSVLQWAEIVLKVLSQNYK